MEYLMFRLLERLAKQANFNGVGDTPNKMNPTLTRSIRGYDPKKYGYAFTASCHEVNEEGNTIEYTYSAIGQWIVGCDVKPYPESNFRIMLAKGEPITSAIVERKLFREDQYTGNQCLGTIDYEINHNSTTNGLPFIKGVDLTITERMEIQILIEDLRSII